MRASLAVALVVLLAWTLYPSRPLQAGDAGVQTTPAWAQTPAPGAQQENPSQVYSTWLSTAHQHVMKDAQAGLLPDQF